MIEDAVLGLEFGMDREGERLVGVRCDSWLPLPPPEHPARDEPPPREQIELPLRGRPLRDKVVLRLIAIDRAFHFVVLVALGVLVLVFATDRATLRHRFGPQPDSRRVRRMGQRARRKRTPSF